MGALLLIYIAYLREVQEGVWEGYEVFIYLSEGVQEGDLLLI